jgi:CHAT domain-containing protein
MIAAARIEKVTANGDTPAKRAALGVAHLALHDFDRAVQELEHATQSEPGNPRFQNDLAAAYLARAAWQSRVDDIPRALAAAERAIGADPRLREPYFNRALALEALHLDDQAAEAWSDCARREGSGPWFTEAQARAASFKSRSISEAASPSTLDHQQVREHIEDELFTRWGVSIVDGDSAGAATALDEAETEARVLAMRGGDAMALDETALIRRLTRRHDGRALRDLAEAHALYGQSRREFAGDRLQQASDTMAEAGAAFARIGSPYVAWAPVYRAIALRVGGSAQMALDLLAAQTSPSSGYLNLTGRLAWTRASALEALGRFDRARDMLAEAVEQFTRAGEIENRTINEMGLADTEWLLGNRREMWLHEIEALSRMRAVRSASRRNALLLDGANFSLSDGLPESALEFQNALVALVENGGSSLARADAHRSRARTLVRLGRLDAARHDVSAAALAVAAVDDAGLRARADAEVQRVQAELSQLDDPVGAVAAATAALTYVRANGNLIRIAELLTVRAHAYEALRDDEHARDDFRDAIAGLEQIRADLAHVQDRMQAVESQRDAYRGLVHLEVALNHPEKALRIAEQGRARTLFDSNAEAGAGDPAEGRNRLPDDTAAIYYSVLDDQVVVWVLTNERVLEFARPLTMARVDDAVRELRALVGQDVSFPQFARAARGLSEQLVLPALDRIRGKTRLVFIPDGALTNISFAILPDALGRPLLETFTVAVAPSFSSFLAMSARLDGFSPRTVLAAGDGHDAAATGLPRLSRADGEAAAVARAYQAATVLTAERVTRDEFLADNRDVVHFAGHTIANPEFPMFSRILLAPNPATGDSGIVLSSELLERRFVATRVVVLASCEAAAGKIVSGEGALSIARAFLQAGVPAVVANLWAVDDGVHSVLVTFHRELRKRADPAAALRAAQLDWLNAGGRDTPVRVWGGFVALGGIKLTAS